MWEPPTRGDIFPGFSTLENNAVRGFLNLHIFLLVAKIYYNTTPPKTNNTPAIYETETIISLDTGAATMASLLNWSDFDPESKP